MEKYIAKTVVVLSCLMLDVFSVVCKENTETLLSVINDTNKKNLAYKKPVRSNLSKPDAGKVNDGDTSSFWSGVFFSAYVDVDLLDVYDIDSIVLHFPQDKSVYYSIYGSNDGKNFDRIYRTREVEPAAGQGDRIIFETPRTYRIVRVNVEFTAADKKAYLSEIEVYGAKGRKKNNKELRQGSLEKILDVRHFDKTPYAKPIGEKEVIENIYGIIDRTIGTDYRSWFEFELAENDGENDWFELSDANGKVKIRGNEGLSLATGLNYYFKNFANVHISEQTKQVRMPDRIVPVGRTIRKETPYRIRYAFNYCTLNYTFAFFGEEEWQRENDWLALNGVNVVLDLAGQEATWIKFLMNFGYSFDDAKDWLTGPSYYAWQFMDNMESFGGPVPDGYVKDRIELARKTQRWKRSLGMQTVLQGYAGMVPTNFGEFQPDAELIKQGNWNGFARPWMIATDSPDYDDYARKFYEAQEFVYGKTSHYYAVDPFHEGGIRPKGLTDDTIAAEVLESMLDYDGVAVWIVQGWQSNPTNSLLEGMGENRNKHVLIVDLIKYPIESWTKYNKLKYDRTTLDSLEFNGTDWAWCLLANFGGNPSMHGQMEVMVEDILTARKESRHMQGIGIISEATHDNPVLYDLIFDLVWADDSFELGAWLDKYIERRYGATSDNARQAWKIMRGTNYDYGVRYTNELFGMKGKGPQNYGKQDIPYGAENLERAFRLLAADFDMFKDSECYRYDMTEIMRQVVSNYAVQRYNDVLKARDEKNLAEFMAGKSDFLRAFDILNDVQATQKDQLGGEWIGKAVDRAADYDDFARDMFPVNAKTLITTWGSRGGSSLKDYGWRNYEGIFLDIYKTIWTEYLDKVEKNLAEGVPIETIPASGYFDFYWNWIMGTQDYTRTAKDSPEDIKRVMGLVLEYCSYDSHQDPDAGNIALQKKVSIQGGNHGPGETSPAITDGMENTSFSFSASSMESEKEEYPEIIVDLIGEFQISKINLLFERLSGLVYGVFVSEDGVNWRAIGGHEIDGDGENIIDVDNVVGRFVKLSCVDIPKPMDVEFVVSEFRVYGERILPSLDQLGRLVAAVKEIDLSHFTKSQAERIAELAASAEESFDNAAPPDEINTVYWSLYDSIASLLKR